MITPRQQLTLDPAGQVSELVVPDVPDAGYTAVEVVTDSNEEPGEFRVAHYNADGTFNVVVWDSVATDRAMRNALLLLTVSHPEVSLFSIYFQTGSRDSASDNRRWLNVFDSEAGTIRTFDAGSGFTVAEAFLHNGKILALTWARSPGRVKILSLEPDLTSPTVIHDVEFPDAGSFFLSQWAGIAEETMIVVLDDQDGSGLDLWNAFPLDGSAHSEDIVPGEQNLPLFRGLRRESVCVALDNSASDAEFKTVATDGTLTTEATRPGFSFDSNTPDLHAFSNLSQAKNGDLVAYPVSGTNFWRWPPDQPPPSGDPVALQTPLDENLLPLFDPHLLLARA